MGQGGQIPDQSVQFYLFDRVVNVRHGYSVPFGLRGTVVGLHKADQEADTMYDVVFDEAFQGGITLRLVGSSGGQVVKPFGSEQGVQGPNAGVWVSLSHVYD